MEKTIDTIVKYLQGKSTTFTVSEINEISQMLVSLKPKAEPKSETEEKPTEAESPREEDGK